MDASSLIVFVVGYYFICMSEDSILEIKLISASTVLVYLKRISKDLPVDSKDCVSKTVLVEV